MQITSSIFLFSTFRNSSEFYFSYVQHRISEQSEWLREILVNQNGLFLLAGNSKNMPKSVKEALGEALNDPDYVQTMIDSGRYQEETWG